MEKQTKPDYASPEMTKDYVNCEKGFCESGVSSQTGHAGFSIKNDYGENFWED